MKDKATGWLEYDPRRPHDLEHVGGILKRLIRAGAFGPESAGVLDKVYGAHQAQGERQDAF